MKKSKLTLDDKLGYAGGIVAILAIIFFAIPYGKFLFTLYIVCFGWLSALAS
ncbi:MAG: hypothetical protein FWG20_00705 [Candidatus Cloacimonetes bacterium]|nr:hypothetical protein [Candidatus Cloacimonadota bacterium]